MAEYIEREAAKQLLINDRAFAAAELLNYIPAADVVEVVRCEACKYNEHGICVNFKGKNLIIKSDFCSNGERRENA